MARRDPVPALPARGPSRPLIPTAPEPAQAEEAAIRLMAYLPPDLVDQLDELVLIGKRKHGRHVNRSAVIAACVELALRQGDDVVLDLLVA